MCKETQARVKKLFEELDEVIMQRHEKGLVVEGLRERRILTLFGHVTIRRRVYRDKSGQRRYLLDEVLRLDKKSPLSPRVKELSALLSSYLPFNKCERLLRLIFPAGVSHTTVHRQIGRITEPDLLCEEREVTASFKDGKIPKTGTRTVPWLFIEADGVNIALQREKEDKGEIKVGIAYEGWQPVGQDRHQLKDKTVYLGIMDGDRFWEGFSLTLARKYDLSSIGKVVVGGDGAHWVRQGVELFGGTYQLDRFHLRRALLRGLGGDVGLANEIYRACLKGDATGADKLLLHAQSGVTREQSTEIAQLRGYLLSNVSGLADYRLKEGINGLRGLGGIEGNVDKLIANRMKKRGMSWTKRGARRMARLIQLQQQGDILSWTKPITTVSEGGAKKVVPLEKLTHYQVWFNADMPALTGPHVNRPWVRALRAIKYGGINPGLRPTES